MTRAELIAFVRESNRIEGIDREPTLDEIEAYTRFLDLMKIEVTELEAFVALIQPEGRLRDRLGMDVRVGNYIPPFGCKGMRLDLQNLLDQISAKLLTPYEAHVAYEKLHPFTDGNGRSGRALWLWMHGGEAPLGFLHTFYYETLRTSR